MKRLFSSKLFFLFNLVLVALIIGFMMGVFSFSANQDKELKTVHAQDNEIDTSELQGLQNAFRSVARNVLPSIVEVNVVAIKKQRVPDDDFPWDYFFKMPDKGEDQPKEREYRNRGLGSGIIIQKDKETYYVLTNEHVVGDASEISIKLYDGREFICEKIGRDPRKDLSLLSFKYDKDDIPIAKLGDSDELQVGDFVWAVGNPFGFESSVTFGIVSALNRRGTGPAGNISDFIQTDAAINRGNSGGALVNIKGEVIGINTWITSPTGGSIGLGFSIPINNAKRVIKEVISEGEVKYGWLGVSIGDLNKEMKERLDLAEYDGAFVYHLFHNSPADKGGILPGDYIISIDGENISNRDELVYAVGDIPPGETAEFQWIRNGKLMKKDITITRRAKEEAIESKSKQLWPGLVLLPLTEEVKEAFEIAEDVEGLIVQQVIPDTAAMTSGIKVGDIVLSINGNKLDTLQQFYKQINNSDKIEIEFKREEAKLRLDFPTFK